MRSVEAVNGLMFTTIFPITFLSNAFARTDVMPAWLRTIAEWNPISALSQAMRDNWGIAGIPVRADAPWPLHHPELATLLWSIAITAVIAPLALRAFNKRTTD
jgi:ABC-type multidrug transport system permease subunit